MIQYNVITGILILMPLRYRAFLPPHENFMLYFDSHAHFSSTATPHQPLVTTNLFFISIILSFSGTLYKWNHKTGNLSRLAFSLNISPWKFIQVFASVKSSVLLLLNNIPWYGCTTVSFTICLWKNRAISKVSITFQNLWDTIKALLRGKCLDLHFIFKRGNVSSH